ncbi:MORN repeat-containing protein 3-like isoform X2 [Belonocnema kinseyi]|uniref:MORN repeat-containing protein 3-like isoform X2 n=1 Tax=Belonocnema kinseyi TaxID=2817044 RepID=UPI00143D61BF|nr:MORN repeat-containing protein 3-like isoform X2 [Belonocnema kinseyi]
MPFLKPIKLSVTKLRTQNSERNGLRNAIFSPEKNKYIGEWSEDKRNGKGIELTSENFIYEGNWLNGKRNGFGILSQNVRKNVYCKRYSGNWVDGKKHGFGAHWYPDESYYEGKFFQNKRQGFGRFWFKNGFYQGNWKNGLFHGEGMLVQVDGNRYEGQFFGGQKEGWGIFYHLKTGQIQEGFWKNDKCLESVMQDIYWRQSAIQPSSFPIPKDNESESQLMM